MRSRHKKCVKNQVGIFCPRTSLRKSDSNSRVGGAAHGVKTSRGCASGRSWGRGRAVRRGVGRVRAGWQQLWAQPGATCPCAWPPACAPRWWMAAARTAEACGVTAPRGRWGVAWLTSPAGRCGFAAGVGLRNCRRWYAILKKVSYVATL